MMQLVEANWPLFVIALVIGIAAAWYVFVVTRKTSVKTDKRDVMDEDAAPAARNQALIDAAPAAPAIPPVDLEAAAPTLAEPPPARAPEPAPASHTDDLAHIKGVGPKLRKLLSEMGVTEVAQIAAWSEADIDRIDSQLGNFEGRIRRDQWVAQAKLLEGGDQSAYEAQFGKG